MKCHCNVPAFVYILIAVLGALLFQPQSSPLSMFKAAYADTPRFEMDAVVVTASRDEETLGDIPRHITVITAEEIAEATSSHVVDLLSSEAGVTLQSFNGSDKNASVDIRGMGARAANNVIVVVDGVRQNSSDLSGTDFSSIALDQIERIEIMRGSGAVLYGDGAVGGVINIITKKPEGPPEKNLYLSYGSYATVDTRASLKTRVKGFGININTGYYDGDGYRDNGFLTKYDGSLKLDYTVDDFAAFWISGSHHQDEYGLPGPVPRADAGAAATRTATRSPNDSGETTDQRLSAGFRTREKQWGSFTGVVTYRFRENPFVLGYSPLLSREAQTSQIDEDSRTVDLRYTKDYTLFKRDHQMQLGIDQFSTRYIREERPSGPRENSAVDNLGFYFTNRWQLTQMLNVNWGYRRHRFDGTFRSDTYETFGSVQRWVNGPEEDKRWDKDAYDLGLAWQINPDVMLFASYATSFRVPNVDELAEAEPDLKPQSGNHIDAGLKIYLGETVECSATLYQIRIEDELYYSEVNRNYTQPTMRRGVETTIKWYPTARHYLWANYTYTSARFEDTDLYVPLVPGHKIDMGWEWQATDGLKFALGATYVGERFDGNDLDNDQFEKLEDYTVADIKLTWVHRSMKLFAAINNLFDERYSTSGYSENYYPMPERNFHGGLEWRF